MTNVSSIIHSDYLFGYFDGSNLASGLAIRMSLIRGRTKKRCCDLSWFEFSKSSRSLLFSVSAALLHGSHLSLRLSGVSGFCKSKSLVEPVVLFLICLLTILNVEVICDGQGFSGILMDKE